MSHFNVAVFTKPGRSIDKLLEPYDENIIVEPYIAYTRQEAIDHERKYYDIADKTDEECWQMGWDPTYQTWGYG